MATKRTTGTKTILIDGAAVVLDFEKGTLRPKTYRDASRLGVGYLPENEREAERWRIRRAAVVDVAIEIGGRREYGWTWVDADYGAPIYFL